MGYEATSEAIRITAEQEAQLISAARERASKDLAEANIAKTEDELFYSTPRAAMGAFRLEHFSVAADLAQKALQLAPQYQSNWNYGNAIHYAHSALGLLALRSGDIRLAVTELQCAGATRGSPQLDSFGPSMQLAKALLKHGEFDPVLEYLHQCRIFWKTGTIWLDLWEQKIRSGEIPNFFMHAYT